MKSEESKILLFEAGNAEMTEIGSYLFTKLMAVGINPVEALQRYENQLYLDEAVITAVGPTLGTTHGTTAITYTPATADKAASISFKNGETKVVVNTSYSTNAVNVFIDDNFKNNVNTLKGLQMFLETTDGRAFISRFMQNNERITLFGNIYNFTQNGDMAPLNNLVFSGDEPAYGVASATTALLRKGTTTQIDNNYNLSLGVDVKVNVGINKGKDFPQVLAHELLVHGLAFTNIVNSLKAKTRGTTAYNNEYNCMIGGPLGVIHHGKMASEKTIEYKNACYELQQKFPLSGQFSLLLMIKTY